MPEFDLFLKTEAREEFAHALATIVANDGVVATGKIGRSSWIAQEYRLAKSPLVYCVNLLVDRKNKRVSLESANPVGSLSSPMRLRVESVEVNKEAGEALVTGKLLDCEEIGIHFFMPWFFLGGEKAVVEGAELSFRFSALALRAETVRETLIELREGPYFEDFLVEWLAENPAADRASAPPVEVDLSRLRAFLTEKPDVAQFQLPASPATRLESPFGAEVWLVDDYFLNMDGRDTLKLPLHIPAAKNPDYDPTANLPVQGRAWILGFMEGKAPGDFATAKDAKKKVASRSNKGTKTAGS